MICILLYVLFAAIIELETVNRDWSNQVLANTYLLKQDTSLANQKLNTLSARIENDIFKKTIDSH